VTVATTKKAPAKVATKVAAKTSTKTATKTKVRTKAGPAPITIPPHVDDELAELWHAF
jgi:hypothetical protein